MQSLLSQLSLWILIMVGVMNLVLTVFVYKFNHKSATNRVFFLLGLAMTFWLAAMYFSLRTYTPQVNLWLIRFSIFFATALNGLFLMLSKTVPSETLALKGKKLGLLTLSTLGVMFLTLTNFIFSGVEVVNGIASPIPGKAIIIFPLYIVITTILIMITLWTRFRKAEGLLKRQLLMILTGITLMLGLIVVTIVIPVMVGRNSSFVPLFPVYTLIFTGMTGYTIIRHGLFSFKVIVAEALVVVLWTILFSRLFVLRDLSELILNGIILIVVSIIGNFLIKSVRNEVAQRELSEKLTKRLKELDAQKDEFISLAAHELRAPMTAIKGYLSMMLDGDAGKLSNTATEFLKEAVDGNDRLIRLVNNMLNVSRIEEGRMVYQMGMVDLKQVVKRVYNEFAVAARDKGLKYELATSEGLFNIVYVDQDRIYEVVANLISNAIKYTDIGLVKVKLSMASPHAIKLEVIDSGRGISTEEQKKLFGKFVRAESSAGKTLGTGLGLYISKLLIEKFGGRIGVVSSPGKGSNFWFVLPVKRSL
ncbi:MAG: two-component sensor histidine kinase [uncultured bacterium]|nr:MAG: two-component sensor histidine kinase [uncultured bacterium]OGM34276.1 MAG: hypothetical protein A3D84_00075 [Candidatus Woesebacteria bacterium RIFCSPHIGHO2_02_FULL_42_20]OGM74037.1 MAG: hypothetical protein A3H21_05010 [Candidatus Woesebacteria bacterium RIFCSPLOWO2_12_FULL_42_8]